MYEVFTKTRGEDVDFSHTNRWNSSCYRRKDNNGATRRGDLTESFLRYELGGGGGGGGGGLVFGVWGALILQDTDF